MSLCVYAKLCCIFPPLNDSQLCSLRREELFVQKSISSRLQEGLNKMVSVSRSLCDKEFCVRSSSVENVHFGQGNIVV